MESHNIEKLLEKYFEATTTVAEETALRKYFMSEGVATHLVQYAPMFQYASQANKERFTKPLLIPKGSKKLFLTWVSAAAAAVLLMGVYFNRTTESSLEKTYTPKEIAAAKEAFSLLAINFNKGTGQLSHLDTFDKNTSKFLIDEQKPFNTK